MAASLRSSEDADWILGFGGNDLIDGGAGNDSIDGLGGNDTIEGGYGFDSLNGLDGDDLLRGGADYDRIWGGAGADTLEAGPGGGELSGGAGDDTFIVHGGDGKVDIFDDLNTNDVSGSDTLFIDANPADVDIYALPITNNGLEEHGVVQWRNDSATVKFALKSLDGSAASMKTIRFRDGSTLDSRLVMPRQVLTGADGKRTLLTAASTKLPDDIQNLSATGAASIYLIGNSQNNVITGNAGNNALNGLPFEIARSRFDSGLVVDPYTGLGRLKFEVRHRTPRKVSVKCNLTTRTSHRLIACRSKPCWQPSSVAGRSPGN
jgi:trimeric autotransporter adhesin